MKGVKTKALNILIWQKEKFSSNWLNATHEDVRIGFGKMYAKEEEKGNSLGYSVNIQCFCVLCPWLVAAALSFVWSLRDLS